VSTEHTSPTRPSPLWAVLALTWLTSFGTSVAWTGVFFVTDTAFDFSRERNLLLGALLGLIYACSAFFASRITNAIRSAGRLRSSGRPLSHRTVLAGVLCCAGAIALLPLLIEREWSVWVFGLFYQPLTGLVWPLVESYVSSGRRGEDLGRAAGRFNIAWSMALIAGLWAMVPLMENHAIWVIGGLAPLHMLSVIVLLWFTRDPGGHGSAAHPHDPEEAARFRTLLRVFRTTLVGSYILHAAITPMLPDIMGRLGIAVTWKPALTSVWMITRLSSFAIMERWVGWHGRTSLAAWSIGCMLLGFVVVLGAGSAMMLGLGLATLGIGIGIAYAGAIYYALEVGSTEIDAGGRHEALIGVGYTVGPLGALAMLPLMRP
jgi:MFS family permease